MMNLPCILLDNNQIILDFVEDCILLFLICKFYKSLLSFISSIIMIKAFILIENRSFLSYLQPEVTSFSPRPTLLSFSGQIFTKQLSSYLLSLHATYPQPGTVTRLTFHKRSISKKCLVAVFTDSSKLFDQFGEVIIKNSQKYQYANALELADLFERED